MCTFDSMLFISAAMTTGRNLGWRTTDQPMVDDGTITARTWLLV